MDRIVSRQRADAIGGSNNRFRLRPASAKVISTGYRSASVAQCPAEQQSLNIVVPAADTTVAARLRGTA